MTVLELIEEIKRLPPEELRAVKLLVQAMEIAADQGPKYVSDEEFEIASKSVFEKYDGLLRRLVD